MASVSKCARMHIENGSVEDRISNLPDSLIGLILSFLPTKSAVATSVLSTKWKYFWTFITRLDFDDELVSESPQKCYKQRQNLAEVSFINFVYRVLTRNVSDLQKFRLRCTRSYDVSHINVWVSTALSRNPRELDLSHIGSVPRELFACTSLDVLKLGGGGYIIDLNVPTSVCLPSLKMLVVESVKFLDDDSIYRLFSRCHVLENLSIKGCDMTNISVLNIYARNLKSLTINCGNGADASDKYSIVLDTPNLRDLKYEDYVAKSYSMNNLNALVKADIKFRGLHGTPNSSITNVLSDFIRGISTVQWLHLSHDSMGPYGSCLFSFPIYKDMFPSVTYLEIGDHNTRVRCQLLDYLVKFSPRLETLIFGGLKKPDWFNPPLSLIGSFCLSFHLKKIEIKWFEGRSDELKMVEHFFRSSRMLEKLMIHPCSGKELEICEKLLMLPRGNKTCRVQIIR